VIYSYTRRKRELRSLGLNVSPQTMNMDKYTICTKCGNPA
jgi:hypothetical protein